MADDDLTKPQENSLTGLSTDDIKPKIYEGGFKTWECSFDLARYLARLIEERKLTFEGKGVHFIEVLAPLLFVTPQCPITFCQPLLIP